LPSEERDLYNASRVTPNSLAICVMPSERAIVPITSKRNSVSFFPGQRQGAQ
jgi:hypothetical protein